MHLNLTEMMTLVILNFQATSRIRNVRRLGSAHERATLPQVKLP
jgi:hypothetical protein